MKSFDVTLSHIEAAQRRIGGRVRRTPSFESQDVSKRLGRRTVLKMEALQIAGSFKVRGVFNKLLALRETEHGRGLVTVSGGNHAIALSRVAGTLGIDALVLMPRVTPSFNIELTKKYGAQIELCDDAAEAFAKAEAYAKNGWLFVHPYDDPDIIAGHGTLGLELLEDTPDLTHVFMSIGGGGFAAGVAAALKAKRPDMVVYGVETVGAPTMTEALKADAPVTIRATSIARTLGAPFATERTLAAAKQFLRGILLVEDAPVVADVSWLLQAEKILCEPAAACVLTAAGEIARSLPDDAVVGLVLCGSNVSLNDVASWRQAAST
ncbi:threonine ammonia-lyase [Microvirga puerhi]|uniref:Pyridoxal-phosphate dependent enzyme n=1 Tax=Microvirga puerhi TaxID=2876078 RepID=A0ABS7VTR9_9HYPH|nr:pyridoxal-phosphate dependent enzyme [Microvirga puerhi]MBZ6078541.1 pyridoxal-phosphate dependent enzyme [Microvirga puerhi]